MGSEPRNQAFRGRLAELVGAEKPFAWARKVGISKGAFARIWNEATLPSAPVLMRIAGATGVSLDWLLAGDLPMRRGRTDAGASAPGGLTEAASAGPLQTSGVLDLELLRTVLEGVEEGLEKVARVMPPDKKAELVAALYEMYAEQDSEPNKEKILRLIVSAA